jgi:hypothetical protein
MREIMKIIKELKFFKDILFHKDVYFQVQIKIEKEWMGSKSCGFYIIPSFLNKDSIVYSFGVGEDISFDEDVITKFRCKVYAFDPTPKSKLFVEKHTNSNKFIFHDYGIADYDGKAKFYLPENPEYVSCTTYNMGI